MNDTRELLRILKREFGYTSPPVPPLLKWLPIWTATTGYYARLMTLIYQSSKMAMKGKYDHDQWRTDSLRIFGFVESVGGRHHVSGLQGVAQHPGPLVFIANHMSMLDTFLLPGLILPFHRVTFVVKASLLRYPVFGAIMRAVHPISLERTNPRKDLKVVLDEGRRILGSGCSLVIFPQSTRSSRFDASTFNSLGVKLAKKTGAWVVPVAMKTDFQANGRFIKEAGPVDPKKEIHIAFGRPMAVTASGQETHRNIISFIEGHLMRWEAPVGIEPGLAL
jgi:1-acyl-sn-glycerol-3-phosphate acyltransferase